MLVRSVALLVAVAACANAFVTPQASISRDVSLNVETVRKKEFVANMAEELGCTKTDAEASLALVLNMISDVSWIRYWKDSIFATRVVFALARTLDTDFDGCGESDALCWTYPCRMNYTNAFQHSWTHNIVSFFVSTHQHRTLPMAKRSTLPDLVPLNHEPERPERDETPRRGKRCKSRLPPLRDSVLPRP